MGCPGAGPRLSNSKRERVVHLARGTTRGTATFLGLITRLSSLVFDTVATPLHQLGISNERETSQPRAAGHFPHRRLRRRCIAAPGGAPLEHDQGVRDAPGGAGHRGTLPAEGWHQGARQGESERAETAGVGLLAGAGCSAPLHDQAPHAAVVKKKKRFVCCESDEEGFSRIRKGLTGGGFFDSE